MKAILMCGINELGQYGKGVLSRVLLKRSQLLLEWLKN